MKDRICFVHIGAHKTGTTVLQRFFTVNRKALKVRGCLYPGTLENHYWLSAVLRKNPLSSPQLKKTTTQIVKEIKEFDGNILLSSEGFSEAPKIPNKLSEFLKRIGFPPDRCRIIYFVRRQDFWLESAYKQQVSQSNIQAVYSFNDFIMEDRLTAPNYFSALSNWANIFGKQNVRANVYEKQQLPEGILKCFCRNIEIPWSDEFQLPRREASNISLSLQDINLIRILNGLKMPAKHHENVVKLLKNSHDGKINQNEELLSPRARLKILKMYEKSNVMVAKDFFGRDDGRLFYDAVPAVNTSWQPPQPIDHERAIQRLVEVIGMMAKSF